MNAPLDTTDTNETADVGPELPTAALPFSVRPLRLVVAMGILVCLSSAPFVQLSVHLAEGGLRRTGWPYVFSYFGAAVLSIVVFSVDVVPTLARSRRAWQLAPVGLFGAWALASSVWTDSPDETPTQTFLVASLLLFGVWFGGSLTREEQGISLLVVTHALVFGSWLFVVVDPDAGMSLGDWVGLFASGNTLGPVAALAALTAIAWLVALRPRRRMVFVGAAIVAFDLFVLIQAGSDTAMLALLSGVIAAGIVPATHWWQARGWSARSLAATTAGLAFAGWLAFYALIDPITSLIGKDPTLSNRRVIWEYLRGEMSDRRLAGFGFGSFWDDPERVYPLYEITLTIYGSAHSTYMETMLGLGVIGAVLLVVLWLQAALAVGRVVWTEPARSGSVGVVMITVFVLIENLTESMIVLHSFFWTLLVSAAFLRPKRSCR